MVCMHLERHAQVPHHGAVSVEASAQQRPPPPLHLYASTCQLQPAPINPHGFSLQRAHSRSPTTSNSPTSEATLRQTSLFPPPRGCMAHGKAPHSHATMSSLSEQGGDSVRWKWTNNLLTVISYLAMRETNNLQLTRFFLASLKFSTHQFQQDRVQNPTACGETWSPSWARSR